MYGNVLTNRQLTRLIADKSLVIKPFQSTSLKEAAYTLNPGHVLKISDDGEWAVAHTFSATKPTFTLKPNEYVVVQPKQDVIISVDGIIGTFIQASSNIEGGLLVVAGQIDSQYGTKGEALHFGVKNLLSSENVISISTRLVHLQLIDLRGSTADPVTRSTEQIGIWEARRKDAKYERADSDGPLPPEA